MKIKINSYQNGDIINGIQFIQHLSYGNKRKALFKCPSCNKNWAVRFDNIKNRGQKKCMSCASKEKFKAHYGNPNRRKIDPEFESLHNEAVRSIKKSAHQRSIPFALSKTFIIATISKPCEYCGISESQERKNRLFTFKHNGLDRVNNDLGYIESNVVSCCITCNKGKSSLTITEWKEYLERLYSFMKNK